MNAYIKRNEDHEKRLEELKRQHRNSIRDLFVGAIALIEFICAVFSAAHFESTDDPKWCFISLAVLAATIVALIIMNIKEEL